MHLLGNIAHEKVGHAVDLRYEVLCVGLSRLQSELVHREAILASCSIPLDVIIHCNIWTGCVDLAHLRRLEDRWYFMNIRFVSRYVALALSYKRDELFVVRQSHELIRSILRSTSLILVVVNKVVVALTAWTKRLKAYRS
jgi:hypothetical protein